MISAGVGGTVESVFADAAHAGSFDFEAVAVVIGTQAGERVICTAAGERGRALLVLDAGDTVSVRGRPYVARDLDGRPVLAVDVSDADLLLTGQGPLSRVWHRITQACGVGSWRPLMRRPDTEVTRG